MGTLAILAQACATTEPTNETVSDAGSATVEASMPIATDESIDTQWEYLRDRYDGDGDGSISADEYDREGRTIDGWDEDGDGVLTEVDFERGSGSGARRGRRGGMRDPLARRMMSRYFQNDEDNTVVKRTEVEQAIGAYDKNFDDVLVATEFRERASELKVVTPGDDSPMVKRFMGDMDPWDTIAAGVDSDESGELSRADLLAFYSKMAGDAGDWKLEGPPSGGQRQAREPAQKNGPAVGTMAPDFELEAPDGDQSVRLSSFQGNKPVALIFGSYT